MAIPSIGCDPESPVSRALVSGEPLAPDDGDGFGTEFDPWIEWGGPRLASGEMPPFEAGEYDIVVLSESMPAASLARVHSVVSQMSGAVFFSVQEREELHFVAAIPHVEDDEPLSELVWDLVGFSDDPRDPAQPRSTSCNVLYQYPGWFGSELNICASGSSPKTYSNLSSYGFNNLASSYYIYTPFTGTLTLYNYTGLSGWLAELEWDDWNFSSSFDNKASSLRFWF